MISGRAHNAEVPQGERRDFHWVGTTIQDLRYAARTLGRSRGFTITAIVVLALGIGVTTAMFSVVNAVLLRPLPYPHPEQLVMLWTEVPSQNLREGRTAYWNIEQWRSQSQSFTDIAFFDAASATLTSADRAEQISVVRHSSNLFSLLGIRPLYGRFHTSDEAERRQHLAVISHRFWQVRFGGSPGAIGKTIKIDGSPASIIGILPSDFHFLKLDADVWEPHTIVPNWEEVGRQRGSGFWSAIGRLRADVSLEQAQAEMNGIARRLDQQLPAGERNRGISLVPLSSQMVGRNARLALWMLTGAVFCVLLVASTNIASLSIARSASREKEIAVRAALGASRARIVRQLLAESLTLSSVAGVLGVVLAWAGIRFILAFRPGNLYRLEEVSIDPYVLGSALGLCVLSGVVVGLAPALTMARCDLRRSSQEGGRSIAGGPATRRIRSALVVSEFALAIVLLVSAGLLVRSLWFVESVSLGFRPERVLSVSLAAPAHMPAEQRTNFYNRVLEEVGSLPGLENAGITSELFVGGSAERTVTAEGNTGTILERMRIRSDEVSARFFEAAGTPLLRGRFFSAADSGDSRPLAVINDAMARRLWPGSDSVGRRFKLGSPDSQAPWFTVVGVVADMRRQGLENEPLPQMFEPLAQNPPRRAILLVRTSSADPLTMAGAVQIAVRRVEKYAPVYAITTLENRLSAFLTERRFQTSLLVGFSVAALLMAAIGIYGLIQYSIANRTREIGIRMALGAQAGEIFRMVVGEGLKLSLAGLVLGLTGALWLGQVGSSLLFGVTATDPIAIIAVSLLLTAVATAACYFPARRAMKIEPLVALRQE
ncbi:MAG TPA: ABC transporter permease [Bryobacteraceae bacterium]|nr:ABC transporter permease [Bryobacteraceae bacterium]